MDKARERALLLAGAKIASDILLDNREAIGNAAWAVGSAAYNMAGDAAGYMGSMGSMLGRFARVSVDTAGTALGNVAYSASTTIGGVVTDATSKAVTMLENVRGFPEIKANIAGLRADIERIDAELHSERQALEILNNEAVLYDRVIKSGAIAIPRHYVASGYAEDAPTSMFTLLGQERNPAIVPNTVPLHLFVLRSTGIAITKFSVSRTLVDRSGKYSGTDILRGVLRGLRAGTGIEHPPSYIVTLCTSDGYLTDIEEGQAYSLKNNDEFILADKTPVTFDAFYDRLHALRANTRQLEQVKTEKEAEIALNAKKIGAATGGRIMKTRSQKTQWQRVVQSVHTQRKAADRRAKFKDSLHIASVVYRRGSSAQY